MKVYVLVEDGNVCLVKNFSKRQQGDKNAEPIRPPCTILICLFSSWLKTC